MAVGAALASSAMLCYFACPTEHVKGMCLAGHQMVDIHLSCHFAWNDGATGAQHTVK